MYKSSLRNSLLLLCLLAVSFSAHASMQRDIVGPPDSQSFGNTAVVLPNGNVAILDREYDLGSVQNVGAVHLYTPNGTMISKVTGSTANDRIGGGGLSVHGQNVYFRSPTWDNGSAADAGAITWINGATGLNGVVDATNSLVGTNANDQIGTFNRTFLSSFDHFVMIHPNWNGGRGAVTLINLNSTPTGPVSASNSLVGANAGDRAGMSGVSVSTYQLGTDHYSVHTVAWNGQRGAFTPCSVTTGCVGEISASNSIVGGNAGDQIGQAGSRLSSGKFVLQSMNWNGNRGAVTLVDPYSFTPGVVSESNSLVGANPGDRVIIVTPLSNGNYVVSSSNYNGNRGIWLLGNGTTGLTGTVTPANGLVGVSANDATDSKVVALTNGNYVIAAPMWDMGSTLNVGAVVFGNGTTGITGNISTANSFTGPNVADQYIGAGGVHPLTNGNYVILSPRWNEERGAATFVNGTTGLVATPSSSNSLVGSAPNDHVGGFFGLIPMARLSNGDYLLQSPDWDNGGIENAGAVTRCSGSTGCSGVLSASNSFAGAATGDQTGSGSIQILPNGNYVILSQAAGRGASTWWNASNPLVGTLSSSNSFMGVTSTDQVGAGVTMLPNGNYLLRSPLCANGAITNAGAVTFVNGNTGITGTISDSNSLMGSSASQRLGEITPLILTNGNYVVHNVAWNSGRGSVTWGSGTTGVVGSVSASNSLVGASPNDRIGYANFTSRIMRLENGDYVVPSLNFDNGVIVDAGAVTQINGETGLTGVVTEQNSLVGSQANETLGGNLLSSNPDGSFTFPTGGPNNLGAAVLGRPRAPLVGKVTRNIATLGRVGDQFFSGNYSVAANRLVSGRPAHNRVTIFKRDTPFDFDGDDRADLAVFRPGAAQWFYQRSSNGTSGGASFGAAGDKMVPADFTGDSKTDISVYRPATGEWFILRSDTGTINSNTFGNATDIPVPADFEGDGKADIAVFRPSTGTWFIAHSSGGFTFTPFGTTGDIPLPNDYDADGLVDLAIFRPNASTGSGEWWMMRSTAGIFVTVFGTNVDKPVPADYTGDGTTDVAFRRADGIWYVLQMDDFNFFAGPFGGGTDRAAPADYDGDGKADLGVVRPSDSAWFVQRSTGGFLIQQFGSPGDEPVPSAYLQ